jgi:hypothetical protein
MFWLGATISGAGDGFGRLCLGDTATFSTGGWKTNQKPIAAVTKKLTIITNSKIG